MPNLISLLLVIGLAAALPAAAFEVRTIDFPGAADTNLIAVNDLGQFVGTEQDGSNAQHAIFFDGKKLKLLDPQGLIGSSPQSFALSINNRGAIAGVYTPPNLRGRGYAGSVTAAVVCPVWAISRRRVRSESEGWTFVSDTTKPALKFFTWRTAAAWSSMLWL